MADELVADFERVIPRGPTVRARFRACGGDAPVTVLFGRSGVGKSTVLRCLAGLDRPDRGTLVLGETVLSDAARGVFVPAQARAVGYVAQQPALFPHLRVEGNLRYGLAPGLARDEARARIERAAAAMGVAGLLHRFPRELSGGEQQRVALARALARGPRLVLLDEPLSALDVPAREALRAELRRALVSAAVPTVLVTHDRGEALALGDRVAVLTEEGVAQQGDVWDVFSRPASVAVARLVGTETVLPARVLEVRDGMAEVALGDAVLHVATAEAFAGESVFACIRAEDVTLESAPAGLSSARNRLRGRVARVQREGALVRVTVECGVALVALVTRASCEELGLSEGATVTAAIKATSVVLVAR